jgi:opacity protein-like surface antigen
MSNMVRFAVLLLLMGVTAGPAVAQPHAVGAWVGRYTDTGGVNDPQSGQWRFGESFAAGASYNFAVAQPLLIGVETSFASPRYQRSVDNVLVTDDNATFLTLMATGRLLTGGAGPVGFYLKGGAGGFFYRLPDIENQSNFAFLTGAGIEYGFDPRRAVHLEWGRFFVFHADEGIETQRIQHSLLRLGLRFGL